MATQPAVIVITHAWYRSALKFINLFFLIKIYFKNCQGNTYGDRCQYCKPGYVEDEGFCVSQSVKELKAKQQAQYEVPDYEDNEAKQTEIEKTPETSIEKATNEPATTTKKKSPEAFDFLNWS